MKAKTICILIAAVAMAGVQSARAGDKEHYLIGGLLGGWILNEVLDEPQVVHHRSVEVVTYSPPPVYCPPPVRYETRQVRVWVPGYQERVVTRFGRVRTRWVSGRYEYCTRRVRVRNEVARPRYRQYDRDDQRRSSSPMSRNNRETYDRDRNQRDRFSGRQRY